MDHLELRQLWAQKAHVMGWKLTPLQGKKPVNLQWTEAPNPTLEQHLSWAARGNVGLRTGDTESDEKGRHGSGILVVDFDFAKLALKIDEASDELASLPCDRTEQNLAEAEAALENAKAFHRSLPITPTVISGSGGFHLYFRAPRPCPGNSESRLMPGVDTRGTGGQIVFVGSVHPDTGTPYLWAKGLSPDDVTVADLPAEILDRLVTRQPAPPATPAPRPASPDADVTPYGRAALERVASVISGAPKGARNSILNSEAFGLFQLYGGGVEIKSAHLIEQTLFGAASACGLVAEDGESSVWSTIRSARAGGEASPKVAPPLGPRRGIRAVKSLPADPEPGGPGDEVTDGAAAEHVYEAPDSAADRPELLVPGLHPRQNAEDNGPHGHEIGNDVFVDSVIACFPPGLIYRRSDVPGEILGEPGNMSFVAMTNERMQIIMDHHLKLGKWINRASDPQPWCRYTNADHELAGLVIEAASRHPSVRELKHVASYPIFLRDYTLAAPGWNELGGVYYDQPPSLVGIENDLPDHVRARAILEDLVIDFPWKQDGPRDASSSSKQNYFGLLLTPMLRPAIAGNVPMHMILSTTPGTGKTLLAGTILGGIYLGKEAPARHLGTTEEERQKTIVSMLLQGETIIHLDNVRDYLDSAHIASLLTSTEYAARRLGLNDSRALTNNTILVTTGNNVKATQEIVRRSVPIWIIPTTDDPSARTDFQHPNLTSYLEEQRPAILGALISMVARWRDGERVAGLWPKGSFGAWAELIGGVLMSNGFGVWRENEKLWERSADTDGEDLRELCRAWWDKFAGTHVKAEELLTIAEDAGVFPQTQKSDKKNGRLISFTRGVLAKHLDAPVLRFFIRRYGAGSNCFYFLEESK